MITKFRGWDEQHKIMHNDFQFIRSGTEGNDWIIFTSDKQKLEDGCVLDNPYFSQQIKIMESIDEYDINGELLFDGDVVKDDAGYIKKIDYSLLHGKYVLRNLDNEGGSTNIGQVKKIGNIYEFNIFEYIRYYVDVKNNDIKFDDNIKIKKY